jgi:hypothetical protein
MSKRQLLGGAAVLAVVAATLWYVLGAPSRDSSLAPDASVRVAVSATAIGTGTWVRYVITVKNLADGTFVGDAKVIDQGQDTDTTPRTPLTSLARNPQLPGVPAAAGESAYQVHLTVPSRTSRTVAVLAPDFFNVVEADMNGTALDTQPVQHPTVIPVAVVSDVETAALTIQDDLHFDQFTPRVVAYGGGAAFPNDPLRLAGYTTVVIDQFDSALLTGAQVQALRDFIGFGGTLVVAGGSGWRRSLAPLPADLLPIRPQSTASVSLAPLAALTGATAAPWAVPVATGALSPGARSLLDATGGVPLVAELAYGAGKVVELTYDPSGDGTAQTTYSDMGWTQALGRGIEQVPGTAPMATSLLGPDPAFTGLLPAADDAPLPPLWLMVLVIGLYIGIVGPLGYLAARRRLGRPALFWVSVPLSAAVFTFSFYVVGSALQGDLQDHEIQVVRVGANQTVNVLEYHRVLFLHRGEHQIVPAPNTLVAPLTLETFRATGSTCERCTSVLGGLASGAEQVLPGDQPSVDESGVVYGSVRVVASSGVERAPVGLDAHLSVQGGRVQGTITNVGAGDVVLLELYSDDGQALHRADVTPGIAAGDRVDVDAALGPGDTTQTSGPEEALLHAVATDALSARGQVVLVGLMRPLPTALTVDGHPPPGAGLAVLVQSVRVAAADTATRDVEDKWLAGTSGDQNSGFSAVYDLSVPAASGALKLTYNPQWTTHIQVYDWTQGAYVTVTGQSVDPATSALPLTSDQVRDGLVRVRMSEPRLSWGSNVWLDSASGQLRPGG